MNILADAPQPTKVSAPAAAPGCTKERVGRTACGSPFEPGQPKHTCHLCGYPEEAHLTGAQRYAADVGELNPRAFARRGRCYLLKAPMREQQAAIDAAKKTEVPTVDLIAGDEL